MPDESDKCPLSNGACSKPKVVQYCLIKGGDTDFFDVCQNCPSLYGINDQVFSSCALCGSTLMSVDAAKIMGCPQCYSQFHALAESMLSNCQQGLVHVGKRPKNISHMNVDQLKNLLRKSVDAEDYEMAAVCKEQIKLKTNSACRPD